MKACLLLESFGWENKDPTMDASVSLECELFVEGKELDDANRRLREMTDRRCRNTQKTKGGK